MELWGRPGAMGQAWGCGVLWGYGAGLELPVWPPDVGRCGSEMWGVASRLTHVGCYGSEMSVQPPDPQLWGAVGQRCPCGLQTHTCGALWVRAWGYGA